VKKKARQEKLVGFPKVASHASSVDAPIKTNVQVVLLVLNNKVNLL